VKYTLVIAAYDEEENIGPLTSRIIRTLCACAEVDWELIYIIEGTDGSRSIVESFGRQHPQIRMIYNQAPSGLGNAFRQGFAAVPADSNVVITMDADLNHQPEEILRLAEAIYSRNADIVIGSRKVRGSVIEGAPFVKTLVSNFVNVLIRQVIGMPVADQTSGYRVYRYDAFRKISFENDGFAFLPEILLQAHSLKLKMVEEPINFKFRVEGESKMKWGATARSYLAMLASRFKKREAR
jgi:dolichol-phosphate mannosyltransferase